MDFKHKKILENNTLGEKLKGLREEAGFSLEKISEKLGITENYIRFLEEGHYENLPGEVYTISFLKKYAQALSINEDKVMKLYADERKVYQKLKSSDHNIYLPPKAKVHFSSFNPKFFRNAVIVLFVLAILAYLGWELMHVMAPPRLEITFPPERYTTSEENLKITGQTTPESKVLVNGKEVSVDTEGKFAEEIVLKEGVNEIKISAYKKQDKVSTITRMILYQLDK
ncbi:MAG: helix-turn-helix domain-containing protein [Patescibacteria group bacterium]